MLAWRDIVSGGDRARSPNRFVIVAAPEPLRTPAGERLFEKWTHVRRRARTGEDRIAAPECALRRPPAVRGDGNPVVAHLDVTDTWRMGDFLAREARQASTGRRN